MLHQFFVVWSHAQNRPEPSPSYPALCRQDTTSTCSTDYGGNIYSQTRTNASNDIFARHAVAKKHSCCRCKVKSDIKCFIFLLSLPFEAKLGANATLAISMTVCRTGAAVKLADKRTVQFVMPVFSVNVITVTEIYRTLKFGHQEDAHRDACNVDDMTGSECAGQQRTTVLLHRGS